MLSGPLAWPGPSGKTARSCRLDVPASRPAPRAALPPLTRRMLHASTRRTPIEPHIARHRQERRAGAHPSGGPPAAPRVPRARAGSQQQAAVRAPPVRAVAARRLRAREVRVRTPGRVHESAPRPRRACPSLPVLHPTTASHTASSFLAPVLSSSSSVTSGPPALLPLPAPQIAVLPASAFRVVFKTFNSFN